MSSPHGHAHIAPLSLYFTIFGALMVGTAITVWVAYLDLGVMNTPVALAIAVTKALLVLLYFMHLRWSERLNVVFIVSSFVGLAILLTFTFSDILTRHPIPFPR